jgi:hypothetical protein
MLDLKRYIDNTFVSVRKGCPSSKGIEIERLTTSFDLYDMIKNLF